MACRAQGTRLLSAADDDLLALAAAEGDLTAFTHLVRRHEKGIRNFLNRLCQGSAGDDLAQETFIRAWRSARSYRGEGRYRAWLFRIAWRLFLTQQSRARKTEEYDPDVHATPLESDPDEMIDITRALALLAPKEREAALLCFGEGFTHPEAASILDMPLGTLKSVVARARQKLIAYLEADDHD